jgi:isocitrate dehydrogenase kinase/phosphatase
LEGEVTQERRPAEIILEQFDNYYADFNAIAVRAKERFEKREWQNVLEDAKTRLRSYRFVLDRMEDELQDVMASSYKNVGSWLEVKQDYLRLIEGRYEADLALTFFYSVMRRVFRDSGVSVEYSDDGIAQKNATFALKPISRTYLARNYANTQELLKAILLDTSSTSPWRTSSSTPA